MNPPAGWYPDPESPTRMRWWDGVTWTQHFSPTNLPPPPTSPPPPTPTVPPSVAVDPTALLESIVALRKEHADLQALVVETREIFLLQEVGLYEYAHPLDSSAEFKDALTKLETEEKECVKAGEAVSGTKKWAINGSEKEGAKMVSDFSKLLLRAYNTEADNLVRTMKPYGLKTSVERLEKMRVSISKLGASMKIEITGKYHAIRVKELELTADYLAKVAEEREREREERARLREEEAVRKEFEREQARLEKEKAHYEAAREALLAKGDADAAANADAKLAEIQNAIEGVVTRAANVRAGYVYVISNIGSFGERVIKIGLTRRLEPMERVRELGDASVPFRFDVHAMIFSDDAVGLETALHGRFADRRVNLVNAHREYFFASVAEVKEALFSLRGDILTYVDTPEALEWRQSEHARRGAALPPPATAKA